MNTDLKITKTEINNISTMVKKSETLKGVWENKFHKGLEELFEIWIYEVYEYQIKFYRSRKDRKEFLKTFKSKIELDFIEYPMSFQSIWKHFKEWYNFRCNMIYNTLYLDEKYYR